MRFYRFRFFWWIKRALCSHDREEVFDSEYGFFDVCSKCGHDFPVVD